MQVNKKKISNQETERDPEIKTEKPVLPFNVWDTQNQGKERKKERERAEIKTNKKEEKTHCDSQSLEVKVTRNQNSEKWNNSAEVIGDYGEYTWNDWVDQWLKKKQNKFWIKGRVFDFADRKLRVREREREKDLRTLHRAQGKRSSPMCISLCVLK